MFPAKTKGISGIELFNFIFPNAMAGKENIQHNINPQNSISTVHDKFSIETIEKNTSPSPFPTASLVTNINAYINTQTPKAMAYSFHFILPETNLTIIAVNAFVIHIHICIFCFTKSSMAHINKNNSAHT